MDSQYNNYLFSLIDAISDSDETVSGNAVERMVKIGPTVVPSLIDALADSNETFRKNAAYILGEIGSPANLIVPSLVQLLADPIQNVSWRACPALAKIGDLAIPALIDVLLDREKHENAHEGAARVLRRLNARGKTVISALVGALYYQSQDVRCEAAFALAKIGNPVAPALIEILLDTQGSENAREEAARILGMLDAPGRAAITAVARALNDQSKNVRCEAAYALAAINAPVKLVAPLLITMLSDLEETVRHSAAFALVALNVPVDKAVQILILSLGNPTNTLRASALRRLGKIVMLPESVVRAIVSSLADPDQAVSLSAVLALRMIGKQAEAAIPDLIRLLTYPQDFVCNTAKSLLRGIGAPVIPACLTALADFDETNSEHVVSVLAGIGQPAVFSLIDSLRDVTNEVIRANAARVLGQIGKPAEVIVPALFRALADPNETVCATADFALKMIGADTDTLIRDLAREKGSINAWGWGAPRLGMLDSSAVPALVNAVADSNVTVREWAAYAMGEIDKLAEFVLPALIKASFDEDKKVRFQATEALGKISVPAELIVPALVSVLADECENVRLQAIHHLGKIHAHTELMVPALVKLLADPDDKVRRFTIKTLGDVGSSAVSALIAVIADPCEFVHQGAVEALRRIGAPATPDLINIRNHENPAVRLSVIKILADIDPHSLDNDAKATETRGIERISNVYKLITKLERFYFIGLACFENDEWKCSRGELAKRLDISEPTVLGTVENVTDFFREYFEQYGHPPEREPFVAADDDNPLAVEEDRIMERTERRAYRFCEPVGRWAWELTRDYLIGVKAMPSSGKLK